MQMRRRVSLSRLQCCCRGRSDKTPLRSDWLASELVSSGWNVKEIQRIIVLSKTFRQQSEGLPNKGSNANAEQPTASPTKELDSSQIDSEARLLWRFPMRRLEAEPIRDSMLAVSGLLSLQRYGRDFDLFDKRGGLSGFNPVETLNPENQRRMVYAHKVRREREAVFDAFDCPDAGQSTALRRESTTPIQALNLLNSRFTLDVCCRRTCTTRSRKPTSRSHPILARLGVLEILNRWTTPATVA